MALLFGFKHGGVSLRYTFRDIFKIKIILLMAVLSAGILLFSTSVFTVQSYNTYLNYHTKKADNLYRHMLGIIDLEVLANGDGSYDFNELSRIFDVGDILLIKKNENGELLPLSGAADFELAASSKIDARLKNAFVGKKAVFFSADTNSVHAVYPIYDSYNVNVLGVIYVLSPFTFLIISTFFANLFKGFIFSAVLIGVLFYFFRKHIEIFSEDLTSTDNLSNLKNRASYEAAINKINSQISNNKGCRTGLIIFDLNDLKQVNDTLGHSAGDKYIRTSADILKETFKNIGTTYRIGGDEFATIIDNYDDDTVNDAINKMLDAVRDANTQNLAFLLEISYGADKFVEGSDLNLFSVINRADDKMFKEKKRMKSQTGRKIR